MSEDSADHKPLIDRIHDGEDLTGADLSNLDFSEQELIRARLRQCRGRKTNFMKATLRYADFAGADLQEAYFIGANLLEANFENADLRQADLYLADLTRARLMGANLEAANLESACLQAADLTRANFHAANLNQANLLDAITLETAFRGASMIETKTIREKPKKPWFGAWLVDRSQYVSNFYMAIITAGMGAIVATMATAVANAPYWAVPVSALLGLSIGFGIGQLLETFSTKAPEILYGRTRNVGYTDIPTKATSPMPPTSAASNAGPKPSKPTAKSWAKPRTKSNPSSASPASSTRACAISIAPASPTSIFLTATPNPWAKITCISSNPVADSRNSGLNYSLPSFLLPTTPRTGSGIRDTRYASRDTLQKTATFLQ